MKKVEFSWKTDHPNNRNRFENQRVSETRTEFQGAKLFASGEFNEQTSCCQQLMVAFPKRRRISRSVLLSLFLDSNFDSYVFFMPMADAWTGRITLGKKNGPTRRCDHDDDVQRKKNSKEKRDFPGGDLVGLLVFWSVVLGSSEKAGRLPEIKEKEFGCQVSFQ